MKPSIRFIFFIFTVIAAVNVFADPQITSWLTANSGQYVRAYTNTAERTSGTTVTTWAKQSVPVYADVPFVASSTSWIYVRCPDLPSYVIGPWLNPNFRPGTLYPTNQHAIIRIPRLAAVQTGTKDMTSTGASGLWVNGVQIFNFTDGKAWDPTNSDFVSGPHIKPTYYWHRNAPTQWAEKTNFDYALGHQIPSGTYHTHQQAVALRYQLGDHVDFNSSTKNYSESAGAPTGHSPILGWSYDGYPIYGPYGYSISNDAGSGIRRMVSGYILRDGRNGTDNLTNNLSVIPAWYARFRQNHFGEAYTTTTPQLRPPVQGTNTLGTFAEDYDYYGDITNPATGQPYVMGTNTFDLDEYNGRWCVTPEFPGGTYAYFVDIDSNGTSAYPYTFAFEFYGNDTGGSVNSITEPVTTNFVGGADSALALNQPVNSNNVVTLVWSSTEGGTYQVENSTDDSSWTVEETGVSAAIGVTTTNTFTNAATGTNYVRVTRTALANYDPVGFESGVVSQTATQSYEPPNNAPTVANSIPDQNATYGTAFSYTVPSNTFTDSDAGQTLTYSAAGNILGAASGISFDGATRTFSATNVDSGNGGTIAGMHTIQVIATDDGNPPLSVTNSFTLTIVPAAASVTPDSFSRVYGETNPVFAGTLSGFAAADSITANYSTTADADSAVGVYPITATLNDPNTTLGNYDVTTNAGTLTITNDSIAICFNFTGTNVNNGTASPMAPSEVAGVWPAANWNNSTNQPSGTLGNLMDSSGAVTPATITWSADGLGTTAAGNTAGDSRMMKGFIDVTNTGTLTVANLPDSIAGGDYDVIVYFDGANGSAGRVAKFTLGSTTIVGKDNTSYAGAYIQATNTTDRNYSTLACNFALFTNVTGNSFTVTTVPGFASVGDPHSEFNGIQIIADSVAHTTITTNPASLIVCDNDPVQFTAAAQSASVLSVQWQVSTDGGNSFTDVPGETNTTIAFNAWITDDGDQYRAVFSGSMGSATTTAATLNVSAIPVATITTNSPVVMANSTGNEASGPDGVADYSWTISNGAITSATNLQTITYTAGASGVVTLNLTVANPGGCTDSNSASLPIVASANAAQSLTNFSSIISLGTNVTENYTFTDPSNGLSVVVAVTMTPYSDSNASPAFAVFDSNKHMAVDSGLGSGDANWIVFYEGANFSASLVSASAGIDTNSIQFGIAGVGFRSDQGYSTIGWTSSAGTSTFTPTNDGLYTLDSALAPLAGTNYTGYLRSQTVGYYQLSDDSSVQGNGLALTVNFTEGAGTQSSDAEIYVSDDSGIIEKLDTNNVGSVFASTGNGPTGVAFDTAGNLYAANYSDGTIEKFDANGVGTIFASGLTGPGALAFDGDGNLYVADSDNTIQEIATNGSISLFADEHLDGPTGLAFDRAGNLFVGNYNDGTIWKFAPDGTGSLFFSGINNFGMAFDAAGNLFVAELDYNVIAKLDTNGVYSIFATNNLGSPISVAFDSVGNLYAVTYDANAVAKFAAGETNSSLLTAPELTGPESVAVWPMPSWLIPPAVPASAPQVATDPANQSICAGGMVSFSAAASGRPRPSVQWQVEPSGGGSFTNIPGATNATYSFPASLSDDGSQFQAVFSNSVSTATTTAATLAVHALPDTTIILSSGTVLANSTTNTASAPFDASATYSWTITNGTITSATDIQTITYTAGASGNVGLTLMAENSSGCADGSSTNVPIYSSIIVTNASVDPRTNSWLTTYAGQYARIYTNDLARTNGISVTTWTNGTTMQKLPAYCGIQEVYSSSNYVYVRSTGLASYVMGAWYANATHTIFLQQDPTNQQVLFRIPRSPTVSAQKSLSGGGAAGIFVDGVAMYNNWDANFWNGSADVSQGGTNGFWNRDAYVNEGVSFDAGYAHQPPDGQYHYHADPLGLRYELGDHVDFNPATKIYSESTNAPTKHSPILGWAADGFPIYGPYGYSISNDAGSGIRRMVSGYVPRNGQFGTDNYSTNGAVRRYIPQWAARLYGVPTNVLSGPTVSSSYPFGRYMEDNDYLGDHGYVQGRDFDLDEYNGRWCVTPEFPDGTYAYFVAINSNGVPVYPYDIGFGYYGNPNGGSVSVIADNVVTNFLGNTNLTSTMNPPTVNNGTVTLTWSAIEGGSYQVEATTNLADSSSWTVLQSGISPDKILGSYTNHSSADTRFYRADRTGVANFDGAGTTIIATSADAPGGSASRGQTVYLTITLPSSPPNPPAGAPITSVTVGSINCSSISYTTQGTVQALCVIPSGYSPTGAQDIVVTFQSPAPAYTLSGGFTIN
ncbi:MAG TPA: YHYH protein [Verrucomicrobiae bacterium]|nr:YHYH protein [Verrucomicrobiae bacterium]